MNEIRQSAIGPAPVRHFNPLTAANSTTDDIVDRLVQMDTLRMLADNICSTRLKRLGYSRRLSSDTPKAGTSTKLRGRINHATSDVHHQYHNSLCSNRNNTHPSCPRSASSFPPQTCIPRPPILSTILVTTRCIQDREGLTALVERWNTPEN